MDKNIKEPRINIIKAVSTPLGFFTLISLIVEAGLGFIALRTSDTTQLVALYGMIAILLILIIVVTLLGFLRPEALMTSEQSMSYISRKIRESSQYQMKKTEVADVNTLGPSVMNVLREKQRQYSDVEKEVKIFTADAREMFTHMKSVILTKWLRKASFKFAIVDPDFHAIDECSPRFSENAKASLELIKELTRKPELADREISIQPTRTYRYHPNIWGVLIDHTDLFIGFHNWVLYNKQPRLEGTEHGIIHLKKGDPLWERFFKLFSSWFEHSRIEKS